VLDTPGIWVSVSKPHVCPASSNAISLRIKASPLEGDAIFAMAESAPKLSDLKANLVFFGKLCLHTLSETKIASASQVVVKALSPKVALNRSRSSWCNLSESHAMGYPSLESTAPIPHGDASVVTHKTSEGGVASSGWTLMRAPASRESKAFAQDKASLTLLT
jgi:hypothetical protein